MLNVTGPNNKPKQTNKKLVSRHEKVPPAMFLVSTHFSLTTGRQVRVQGTGAAAGGAQPELAAGARGAGNAGHTGQRSTTGHKNGGGGHQPAAGTGQLQPPLGRPGAGPVHAANAHARRSPQVGRPHNRPSVMTDIDISVTHAKLHFHLNQTNDSKN